MIGGICHSIQKTDPEFVKIWDHFAFDEVTNKAGQQPDAPVRWLAILAAHAAGNMNIGNDRALLTRVVSQCLPYIGYPRSLNALACIQRAAEQKQKEGDTNE